MEPHDRAEQAAADRPAYPLETNERALLGKRPDYTLRGAPKPVGFGLSGGGIRSATFCLGLFGALGKLKLLKDIDYISSVSGGSYFASFYGRLFTRDVRNIDDIAGILAPNETEPANAGTNDWMRKAFRWLRENGRYLSPHGAGDLLLDLSVVLRNLLSMQIIMGIFVLMFLLAAQLIRAGVQSLARGAVWHQYYESFYRILPFRDYLWWSPYTLPALALFVLAAIPAGWAYWLLSNQRAKEPGGLFFSLWPWVVPILICVTAIAAILSYKFHVIQKFREIEWSVFVWSTGPALVSFMTLVLGVLVAIYAWRKSGAQVQTQGEGAKPAGEGKRNASEGPQVGQNIDPSDIAGNLLSRALKVALVASLSLLGFALIDTLGQTAYAEGFRNWKWLVPLAGPIALATPLAPFAQWVVSNLAGKARGKSVGIPIGIVAGIAAALVIIPVLILLDGLSQAVAYGWQWPVSPQGFIEAAGGGASVRIQRLPIFLVLATATVLSGLASRSRRFLNASSLHALYTARLVRAYLGASNPERHRGRGLPVTDPIANDDIAQEEYWKAAGGDIYGKSAPIHLLNVTINETYDGRSELEQHDRKGLGMAIGPSGISVGVKHHVAFDQTKTGREQYAKVAITPQSDIEGPRVFNYGQSKAYGGQLLALGSWTGISGAAFTTGLGFRTSLPLSLLAGLFNVRLGYWWDSGITARAPSRATIGDRFGRLLRRLFPVQRELLNEFLSRFPGTSEQYWYLSDGGHFENMGGYELIRRRLPLIVIIDAEADANYTYEGLAGLVQKARLDFGAEIEFCDENKLNGKLGNDTQVRRVFGTLEQLRRGTWAEEPVRDPVTQHNRLSLAPVDSERFSLAHAALAEVTYCAEDGRPQEVGWLILIKPTLTGDEPTDVLRYHNQHRSFPHETTADQWFDESQWESYRKLGEHIGMKVFGAFPPNAFPNFNCPLQSAPDGAELPLV